jgi:hypothetical protein
MTAEDHTDVGSEEEQRAEQFEKDVTEIERTQLSGELDAMELHMAANDPGDGVRYALQMCPEESSTVVWESNYYGANEFGAFLEGMRASGDMARKAARELSLSE